jgi:hypothetical protein
MQQLRLVLEFPLQLLERRRRFLNFSAHERFLFFSEIELARMTQDHVRWEHEMGQWIWWRRRMWMLWNITGAARLGRLGRLLRLLTGYDCCNQKCGCKKDGDR